MTAAVPDSNANAALRNGLLGIALMLIAASIVLAIAGCFSATIWSADPAAARNGLLATISLTLGATLIGFVPLLLLLSGGAENIVAAWLAAMLVRMFLCLTGLLAMIKGVGLPAVVCALTLVGTYVVLLGIETAAMSRLIGRLTRKSE